MTDQVYPSHPSLAGGAIEADLSQSSNPYLMKALSSSVLQINSGRDCPMPQLPQTSGFSGQLTSVPEFLPVDEPFHVEEPAGKLLQGVVWAEPMATTAIVPNSGAVQSGNVQNGGVSRDYPPMPSVQTQSLTPPIKNSKNSLSAIRQGFAPRLKKALKQDKPKPVIGKTAAHPQKPRPASLVFLIGALFGALIAYVLTTTFAHLAAEKEYAVITAASQAAPIIPSAVTQAESLNP